jgi:hypothetical protein
MSAPSWLLSGKAYRFGQLLTITTASRRSVGIYSMLYVNWVDNCKSSSGLQTPLLVYGRLCYTEYYLKFTSMHDRFLASIVCRPRGRGAGASSCKAWARESKQGSQCTAASQQCGDCIQGAKGSVGGGWRTCPPSQLYRAWARWRSHHPRCVCILTLYLLCLNALIISLASLGTLECSGYAYGNLWARSIRAPHYGKQHCIIVADLCKFMESIRSGRICIFKTPWPSKWVSLDALSPLWRSFRWCNSCHVLVICCSAGKSYLA